jgi:hypothetical protein
MQSSTSHSALVADFGSALRRLGFALAIGVAAAIVAYCLVAVVVPPDGIATIDPDSHQLGFVYASRFVYVVTAFAGGVAALLALVVGRRR